MPTGIYKREYNKIYTAERAMKISLSQKGKKLSKSHIENLKKSHLGHKHSEETRKKMSEAHKGIIFSPEHRKNLSSSQKGENNNFWKGGVYPENLKIRGLVEYKLWRESVFKRDNFTCQECKQVGGKLNADHIKPFSLYPELRFAIDNGRTLCVPCHKKTDTYGWKIKNYKI